MVNKIRINTHPSPEYQGEELVEAAVSTDGSGGNEDSNEIIDKLAGDKLNV